MDPTSPGAIVSIVGAVVTAVVSTLAFVARLVYTGKLVPKSTVDEVRKDRDDRVARAEEIADEYRKANEVLFGTVHTQSGQIARLLESAQTTHALLNAIKLAVEQQRGNPATPHQGYPGRR